VNLRTRLRALAVAAACLLPLLAVPTALAASAEVQLSASTAAMTFGDVVTLSGTAIGDAACSSGRAVGLEWQAEGETAFSTVAQGTTAADGSFSFDQSQAFTGRFRAALPQTASCPASTSQEVAVRVGALVEASAPTGPVDAGTCVETVVAVSPAKPGQSVDVQRRADGAWTTTGSVQLNGDGQGRAEPCLGWEDIGTALFRFRWTAQDPLNDPGSSPILALQVTEAGWMLRIDDAIGARAVSVSVADQGVALYRHADATPRAPASNEKLLLAMAALDTFGPDHRIRTLASARSFDHGVVDGDLWLLGRGDPTVGRASLGALARSLLDAGLRRVRGSVMGSTGFFERDWYAPGWNEVARAYVNRPTALTFEGNGDPDPEREAAEALTRQLRRRGVRVTGEPGAGPAPGGLEELAATDSRELRVVLAQILRPSWNFGAEVLGKALGAEVRGAPGTIAKGAATIEAWAEQRGVDLSLFDNSGLSYDDRVTTAGIVELLAQAEAEDWGTALRQALPTGGQGTLRDRLHGVRVRAKTGTLTDISALSGWVLARPDGEWIEFSILSAGMSKSVASAIEDRIVRILRSDVSRVRDSTRSPI
jgi:D-alanyl-D-alanine carboxypeptidase/D-alanyl-D-alanine-endopeptidase (penicillin-binding protein 4)